MERMSPSSSSSMAEATRLLMAARERWLLKDEILFLLLNCMTGGLPVQLAPQYQPPSGTLFVCDSVMDFKKDGWTWQKQKGSKTKIREDRAKLAVNREHVVLGVYVHSADMPSFHRRSYTLRDETHRMILVHYLDDSKKPKSPENQFESTSSTSLVDEALADFDQSDDDAFGDLILDNNMSDILYDHPPSNQDLHSPPMPRDIPMVHITDFSPNWDFCTGGAKVLICVGAPPQWSTLYVAFGDAVVPAEQISATVLRCCAPASKAAGEITLRVATYVNQQIVAVTNDGVFLYKSPPDEMSSPVPPMSMLAVTTHGDWDTESKSLTFSETQSVKRARSENFDSLSNLSYPSSPTNSLRGLDELDERQYKIRVVERLNEFRRVISQPKPVVCQEPSLMILDDTAIAALSDKELGSLSEQLIEDVVKQLVALAGTSPELLEELNSLDDAGLSLLHYVCFYNCGQLVPLLLSHGANVNQRSDKGQTPLHLAAGCGHMGIVQLLLSEQADCSMLDLDNYTPADRAENCGHMSIAAYLRSLSPPTPPKLSSFDELKCIGLLLDPESSDRYNRKFLLGAFSTMSLHDKCALSLGTKRRGNSIGDPFDDYTSENELEVSSVMTDNDDGKLMAAMELMGPDELALLEEEARVIQNNVRAWLLRRSYRHMRDTTRKLQEATQTIAKQKMDREKAAVTVQAATRSMLVRRNFLHQRNTAIKVQAAARGIICRKKFAQMKKDALASLVIQRNATGKPPTN
ncbi:Aste57867_24703 [Aphanomyces stellatus]|uniref:Aste57867_24703 protein n=1 Tax=Aphanomyces stellatus TaxID=120398 RepID=A0A485LR85_9STRA|nr:hypothetical protein As57867_024625 [Aphanomyces stellatus]VFU01340.1 Aste57867_24703 [Aphanomyces stellatus]